MYRIVKFLIVCLVVIPSVARATSLDFAISEALIHNPEIRLEEARLNTSKAQYGDVYSNFLPTIKATAQIGKQKKDIQDFDDSDDDELKDDDYRQISFSQPVFNGYKSYNYKQQAGYEVAASEAYFVNVKNEITLSVIEAYLNVYKFRAILALKEKRLVLTKKSLSYANQRNRLGQLGGKDLIEYEVSLNNIVIEKLDAKRELVLAEEEYRQLVGSLHQEFSLAKNIELHLAEDKLLSKAYSNNPLLQRYYFNERSARSNVNIARGSFLPTVSFEASFTREDNVDYLDYQDLETKSYYFNFSIPIFQAGSEYVGLNQAKEEMVFAEQEAFFYEKKIKQELSKSLRKYNSLRSKIESFSELLKLFQDRIAKIRQQVKFGEGDILDLLSVQIELKNLEERQLFDQIEIAYNYYFIKIITEGEYKHL